MIGWNYDLDAKLNRDGYCLDLDLDLELEDYEIVETVRTFSEVFSIALTAVRIVGVVGVAALIELEGKTCGPLSM